MLEILTRITEGHGELEDIDRLDRLGKMIQETSLCGLGQTAPNPVLSTIRHFRAEYEAHIVEKRCPAAACKALIHYRIDLDKCTGCGACLKPCPVAAISGEKKKTHVIDREKCIKCGICRDRCKFDAVLVA
jgi:ferredoxin